jgi:hypothetical protein
MPAIFLIAYIGHDVSQSAVLEVIIIPEIANRVANLAKMQPPACSDMKYSPPASA